MSNMQNSELEEFKDYIPAQGPQGLSRVLEDLLAQSKHDPAFAAKEHFISYSIGEQKSYIKVDMSKDPVLFWYFDSWGRPPTRIVKETIAKFLWEKCGEKEHFLESSESKE
jgi:hypothetical protein